MLILDICEKPMLNVEQGGEVGPAVIVAKGFGSDNAPLEGAVLLQKPFKRRGTLATIGS